MGCLVWWDVLYGVAFVFCGFVSLFALCVLLGGMFVVRLLFLFVCAAAWLSFCLAVLLFGCTVVLVWL